MVLSTAVFIGFGSGLLRAVVARRRYQVLPLRLPWLVLIAFCVQALIFNRSGLPVHLPDGWASLGLVLSQGLLLVFAWANRRHAALTLMGLGLLLNFLVICLNGGWMPISPDTVRTIYPNVPSESWQVGQRLGTGKDIVIYPDDMRLAFLADRFVLPAWSGSLVAFSLGDILLACGAGWLLWSLGGQRVGVNMNHPVSTPYGQGPVNQLNLEVSRLLSAAVISPRFRQLLLSNPAKALEIGFAGERFDFPREAKRRVTSIQAATLADFADQVHRGMDSLVLASWSGD